MEAEVVSYQVAMKCWPGRQEGQLEAHTVPGSESGTAPSVELKVVDIVPVLRANALGSSAILKIFEPPRALQFIVIENG